MPDETQRKLPLSKRPGKGWRYFSLEPQHCSLHIIHGVLGEVLLHIARLS